MLELDDDDLLRRATEAARRDLPSAIVTGLRRLEGGVSSLTYASILQAPVGDREIVLKVAPPGLPPVRNRDVLRQARVLDALHGLQGFPVPAVLFRDPGAPPEVPPLFGMELCPGEAYEPLLDVHDQPPTAEVAAERMRVAARSLARLQARTPYSLGLGEEPVVPVADELARWQRLFATVDRDIGTGHEELAQRLAERVPVDGAPVLLHGDYRVANMLFVGEELQAVIDWEIWSVGDPRSDLAWLLMHADPAHEFNADRPAADREAGRLVPSADRLLEDYLAVRREREASAEQLATLTEDLDWFLALCHYKTASTIAVIYKRERKAGHADPALRHAGEHLDAVLAAGHRALDRRSGRPRR